MEELILLYYLRIISLIFILVSLYLSYLFFLKDIESLNSNVIIENSYDETSDVFDLLDDSESKIYDISS